MMSNSFGQWLLVQWAVGGNSVINIDDLINNKQKLSVGDTVQIAGRRGIPKQGTLLKISDRIELLRPNNMEAVVNDFDNDHRIYNEPEDRDFSGSSESWRPEKTYESSEDEEIEKVPNVRIKTEQSRRSYGRKGKKSQTPTLRPTPVVPKNFPSSQSKYKPTKDNGNMRKNKVYHNRTVQAFADSTRKASASPQIPKANPIQSDTEMVTVKAQELDTFKKELEYLSQMIQNTKEILKTLRPSNQRAIDNLYETVYPTYNKTANSMGETIVINDISQESVNNSNVYEFRSPSVEPPKPNGNIKQLRYGVVKRKSKHSGHDLSADNSMNNTSTPLHTPNDRKSKPIGRYSNSSEEKSASYVHEMVPLGTGTTLVPKHIYDQIKWSSYTMATRKLLMAVFPRRMLATHSLTGKASPAFMNKPAKLSLDPKKVFDIVLTVTEKCKVKDSLVRSAITTKCADENKMQRMRKLKERLSKAEEKTPLRHIDNCETEEPNDM